MKLEKLNGKGGKAGQIGGWQAAGPKPRDWIVDRDGAETVSRAISAERVLLG